MHQTDAHVAFHSAVGGIELGVKHGNAIRFGTLANTFKRRVEIAQRAVVFGKVLAVCRRYTAGCGTVIAVINEKQFGCGCRKRQSSFFSRP
jgi:hypothetical protein